MLIDWKKHNISIFQWLLAGIFIILSSSTTICMGKSKSLEAHQYPYIVGTAVFLAEASKLVLCSIMTVIAWKRNPNSVVFSWRSSIHYIVPGLFYFMDNNIRYFVLLHFNPAIAALLSNIVVVTTAVLFRAILKRHVSVIQWLALVILLLGIIVTQSQHVFRNNESITNSTAKARIATTDKNMPLYQGFLFVLIQCLCASFANIYNEKIFKNDFDVNINFQNVQLYFYGLVFNFVGLFSYPEYREELLSKGFFHGYSHWTIAVIFLMTLTGLFVAMILKFADNMVHILANVISQIVIMCAGILLFNFKPTLEFFLGVGIVFCAIIVYNVEKVRTADFNEPIAGVEDEGFELSSFNSDSNNRGSYLLQKDFEVMSTDSC